jgi:hypothetical protein
MSDSPEQLRAEIEDSRERLGETVEELAAKADVKGRVQEAATERVEAVKRRPHVPIAVGVGLAAVVVIVLRRRG